jgi:hypothetical protein
MAVVLTANKITLNHVKKSEIMQSLIIKLIMVRNSYECFFIANSHKTILKTQEAKKNALNW